MRCLNKWNRHKFEGGICRRCSKAKNITEKRHESTAASSESEKEIANDKSQNQAFSA
jgi:hypothetical protein